MVSITLYSIYLKKYTYTRWTWFFSLFEYINLGLALWAAITYHSLQIHLLEHDYANMATTVRLKFDEMHWALKFCRQIISPISKIVVWLSCTNHKMFSFQTQFHQLLLMVWNFLLVFDILHSYINKYTQYKNRYMIRYFLWLMVLYTFVKIFKLTLP